MHQWDSMKLTERIRRSRRKAGCTQQALAEQLGVNRSAVANWESVGGSSPSSDHLQRLAKACDVSYEWLATGRGDIILPGHMHDVPAADVVLVEDPAEMRLLRAWRNASARFKVLLLELAELQPGEARKPPPAPMNSDALYPS